MTYETSGTTKPMLLLDIDGCANAFGGWISVYDAEGKVVDSVAPEGYYEARANGYWLLIPEQMPQWIAELEQEYGIVHSTMWQENAWMFWAAAGLNVDWPFIDFDAANLSGRNVGMRGQGVGSYKHPGWLDTIADAPAAIVDDDATDAQMQWARERNEVIPTLIIRPDDAVGITREHVDALLLFAREAQEWLDSQPSCATV